MSEELLFNRPDLIGRTGVRPERDPDAFRARRTVYLPASAAPEDAGDRYLLTVRAAHRTLSADHIFSHESGLVSLGLPSFRPWPAQVHLICERRSGGRSQLDVVRHCVGLEDVEPVLVDGMLVTSPGRTAFGIALSRPFVEAVVVADRPGFQKAIAVLAFADELSGSVLESWGRVEMDDLGFAKPVVQFVVTTDGMDEFADFAWPEFLALAEADGQGKYRDERMRRGRSVADVVIDEKDRENRFRRQYPNLARWDWWDVRDKRLERILLQADVPKRNVWPDRRPAVAVGPPREARRGEAGAARVRPAW